jgi:pimeloyl-ACP methyl ester carboxylesterase
MTRARPAWVPDEHYPFTDRYAEVAGCVVHYVDEGAGPPLLLLHGNPTMETTLMLHGELAIPPVVADSTAAPHQE